MNTMDMYSREKAAQAHLSDLRREAQYRARLRTEQPAPGNPRRAHLLAAGARAALLVALLAGLLLLTACAPSVPALAAHRAAAPQHGFGLRQPIGHSLASGDGLAAAVRPAPFAPVEFLADPGPLVYQTAGLPDACPARLVGERGAAARC